jgi:hypothetical protein
VQWDAAPIKISFQVWLRCYAVAVMRPSRLALAVIAVVAAILFFPSRRTVAPEWTICTLDPDRHPLANVTVREVWQEYSLENEGHEEDRLTDSGGRVQFPRRNLRSS